MAYSSLAPQAHLVPVCAHPLVCAWRRGERASDVGEGLGDRCGQGRRETRETGGDSMSAACAADVVMCVSRLSHLALASCCKAGCCLGTSSNTLQAVYVGAGGCSDALSSPVTTC